MPRQRPIVPPEQIERVLERIADGKSMVVACTGDDVPNRREFTRLLDENTELAHRYARACEERAEKMAEECIGISDNGTNDTFTTEDGREMTNHDVIQRSKLRVDTRRWFASKLHPKKYGDKVAIEHSGSIGIQLDPAQVAARARQLSPVLANLRLPAAPVIEIEN